MEWFIIYLFLTAHFSMTQAACSPAIKFYVDCGTVRTSSAASQFCLSHQMTLANLTNGTASLSSDITLLNTTFKAKNCAGYFWFASGSRPDLVADASALTDLYDVLTNVVTNIVCVIPFLCPAATTLAPITNAFTVCTRPMQQRVIQKCSTNVQRADIQQFRFSEQSMLAGVLNSFPSRSSTACSGSCSSNDVCIGMLFNNGICTLYM